MDRVCVLPPAVGGGEFVITTTIDERDCSQKEGKEAEREPGGGGSVHIKCSLGGAESMPQEGNVMTPLALVTSFLLVLLLRLRGRTNFRGRTICRSL